MSGSTNLISIYSYDDDMNILVTGCFGFIGSHLCQHLIQRGHEVIGLDNLTPYEFEEFVGDKAYTVQSHELKLENLKLISDSTSSGNKQFKFYQLDLNHDLNKRLPQVDLVIHLAARAGVRPSIADPQGYIDTNITGTCNMLEYMRHAGVKKMVFASSSSVYGNNKVPFSESDMTDESVSPYAFTKKACEVMNHSYHEIYDLDIVNLRFFTVYGPRQRPDLAIHKFARQIKAEHPVTMYGDGSMSRDYTYIDDTCDGILKASDHVMTNEGVFETLNLGNSNPTRLDDLIDLIYDQIGTERKITRLPEQPGDVKSTYADVSRAKELIGYDPQTPIEEGIEKFAAWFKTQQ